MRITDGDLVKLEVRLTVTGSGTGSNDITIGALPVAPADTTGKLPIGTAYLDDSGTAHYVGALFATSSTQAKMRIDQGGGGTGFIGTAPSLALANNDTIGFTAEYEAA